VAEISPVAVTIPTTVASPTVPLTQPIAAGLSFLNDDITLSPRTKQQLETFARLAKGNMLKQITITQRTVAPLDALTTLADARRKLILDQLKTLGAINDATQVSEVRTRSTAATSKITLIGN
jgi:hypothetical protein